MRNLQKFVLPVFITLSAISISLSAAFYSITGLSKLFSGAATAVIIMASSLEASKLVIASLLYQYWRSIHNFLRTYLLLAAGILILITSIGIYGFLSAAYQETYKEYLSTRSEIEFLNEKKDFYIEDVERYDKELQQISENIGILSNARSTQIQVRDTNSTSGVRTTVSTAELRLSQDRIKAEELNRAIILSQRSVAADSIKSISLEILSLETDTELSAELGPLEYLSGLTGYSMDRIVNWLLLLIVFVFDPLAIALVVAANFAINKAFTNSVNKNYTEKTLLLDDIEVQYDEVVPTKKDNVKNKEDISILKENIPSKIYKKIKRVLQTAPSSLRVQFEDGTEGWVSKNDVIIKNGKPDSTEIKDYL